MPLKKTRYLLAVCTSLLVISPAAAWANGPCSPGKRLVQGAKAFYDAKPGLTNIIQPRLDVSVVGMNGYPDPSGMLYRWEDVEHNLPIVDGRVQNLELAATWPSEGELCTVYSGEPPEKTEESTANLSVSFEFPYLRKDGVFTIDEIKEGAKDGSKIIKSLAPKGLGFVAPSLKTFVVTTNSPEDRLPTLTFLRDGDIVDVKTSEFHTMQYVRLKDLKSAKVDAVKINGPYKAIAFFKIDHDEMAENEAKRLAELEAGEN